MPDAARSGLRMRKFDGPPPAALDPGAPRRPAPDPDRASRTSPARPCPRASDGAAYYVFDVVRAAPSPWHGGFTYVDIMRKDVTEKFLDLTLNGYKQRDRRGVRPDRSRRLPGRGRDLPGRRPRGRELHPGPLPGLPDALGLRPPARASSASSRRSANWKRVRHDFYATLLDLFIENWAKPYYDYATDNKLVFTGHYWEHEWPRPRVSPDNLAMAAYAHMPGHRHPDERVRDRPRTPSSATPGPSARSAAPPTSSAASGRCPRPTAPAAGT